MLQDSPLNIYLDSDSLSYFLTGFCSTLKGMIKTASENIKAASDTFFWDVFEMILYLLR